MACGVATVVLLAIGSFAIAATRHGASAELRLDEIRPFFDHPSPWHLWFYALVPVLGLYALNVALATWHSVITRWRAGVRSPFRYGAAVFHVAFLCALFAHLVGGLWAGERGTVVAGSAWTAVGDGRDIRLVDLSVDTYPNHQPRQVAARVELRGPSGRVEQRTAGFNQPISDGWGSRLLLLNSWGQMPPSVRFTLGAASCTAAPGESCELGQRMLVLDEVKTVPDSGVQIPVITLGGGGESPRTVWIAPGGAELPDGHLDAELVPAGPAVLFRYRYAPGNPWALLASLLLVLGVGLLGRRWVR